MERFYTPLYSGQSHAIFSAASKLYHLNEIHNLRNVVLLRYKNRGLTATWDMDDSAITDSGQQGSSGKYLKWETTFTSDKGKKEILFVESLQGVSSCLLTVFVNGNEVTSIPDGARFNASRFHAVLSALEDI